MLPSSFHFDEASRFDATGRLHLVPARPAASGFFRPACGFTEEKRQPPSRRSGALARRVGGRAGAVHRFRFKAQQIAFLRAGFEDEDENEDDPASVS
jgi:hypothetical protein